MVKNLADVGEREGLVIQALQQTRGRGRHGNEWSSPMGNLYTSLLLRPSCKTGQVGQMAFVVALALSSAMDDVMEDGHKKTLKWPNDILIDGKKVSGILLESKLDSHDRVDYVVVGAGVNIFAAPEGAVGLDTIKRERLAINHFRDMYLSNLLRYYNDWQNLGFAPIREAWLKQAHGVGAPMKIRLPETAYEGVFLGIDDVGTLMVDMGGEIKKFTSGEVHFGVVG